MTLTAAAVYDIKNLKQTQISLKQF